MIVYRCDRCGVDVKKDDISRLEIVRKAFPFDSEKNMRVDCLCIKCSEYLKRVICAEMPESYDSERR